VISENKCEIFFIHFFLFFYRVKAQRSNSYYIKFRTLKSNGLILYQNGKSNVLGDYLAIAIIRGKVEFSYNLGKQSENDLHIMRSIVDVDDGGWHYISAERLVPKIS
jgi:cadherin EGF LAG seven-pass G-type receptor 1